MIKTCTEYITEKLGVSNDGEILADFLIDFLSEAAPGNIYLFVKEGTDVPENTKAIVVPELPDLEKNVYKVYVDYSTKNMGGIQAYFDPKKSKYTKNGYILYFTFLYKPEKTSIWKHYIYHEIHHGMQFIFMTKKRMLHNPKYTKFHLIRDGKMSVVYQEFLQYLYQTINIEQGAFIVQFYGKLKHRKNIKTIGDLSKYFKKRDIYEYRTAYSLAYCDLKKLFDAKVKNPMTNEIVPLTNREEMRTFFSLLKKLGKEINKFETIDKFLEKLSKVGIGKIEEKDIISDIELDATIKNYNKYFNKVGKNLIKKLDKTYAKLLDYYTDKIENPEKYKKREINLPPPPNPKIQLPEFLKKLIKGDKDKEIE